MTLQDISIFKHFIAEKDLRKPFCKVYRASYEFAKLPASVEEFFSNVEPLTVILSGCRVCRPNDIYGYDFWQNLHQDWKVYYQKTLALNFLNLNDGRLEKLEGYYMILRENWDNKDKPWRYEEVPVALERLGLPPIEEDEESQQEVENFTHKFKVGDLVRGKITKEEVTILKLGERCYFCDDGGVIAYDKENMWELAEEVVEEDNDLDIAFIDIDTTTRRVNNALHKGIMSVNTRNRAGRITLNRTDSKEIKKKEVGFVRVGRIPNGDVMIMFCNYTKGIPVNHTQDGYCNINSRTFIENLNQLIGNEKDLAYFRMDKVSEKIDSITYKITKQQ